MFTVGTIWILTHVAPSWHKFHKPLVTPPSPTPRLSRIADPETSCTVSYSLIGGWIGGLGFEPEVLLTPNGEGAPQRPNPQTKPRSRGKATLGSCSKTQRKALGSDAGEIRGIVRPSP